MLSLALSVSAQEMHTFFIIEKTPTDSTNTSGSIHVISLSEEDHFLIDIDSCHYLLAGVGEKLTAEVIDRNEKGKISSLDSESFLFEVFSEKEKAQIEKDNFYMKILEIRKRKREYNPYVADSLQYKSGNMYDVLRCLNVISNNNH